MTKSRPLVSILVPTYNQEAYIGDTIRSALNQSYPNWELIIVDDCSTDGTWEKIQELAQDAQRITIIRNEHNLGLIANWKKLIDASQGDFIAFLEGDDVMVETNLEQKLAIFSSFVQVGLVYSDIGIINAKGSVTIESYYRRYGIETFKNSPISPQKFLAAPVGLMVTYSQIMIRKSLLQTIGLPRSLDSEKSFLPSDWDFNQRASEATEVYFLDDSLLLYRKHAGNGGGDTPKVTRQLDLILDDIEKRYRGDRAIDRAVRQKRAMQRYFLSIYYLEKQQRTQAWRACMEYFRLGGVGALRNVGMNCKLLVRLVLPHRLNAVIIKKVTNAPS